MDQSVWRAIRHRGETIYKLILSIAAGIMAITAIVKAYYWAVGFP